MLIFFTLLTQGCHSAVLVLHHKPNLYLSSAESGRSAGQAKTHGKKRNGTDLSSKPSGMAQLAAKEPRQKRRSVGGILQEELRKAHA